MLSLELALNRPAVCATANVLVASRLHPTDPPSPLPSFIGVGFSASSVSLSRLPGWEKGSWGYHGDDGCAFEGSGKGRPYGPTFTTGDVIGCSLVRGRGRGG